MYAIIIVVGIIAILLIKAAVDFNKGKTLNKKFAALKKLDGLKESQIVAAVGNYTSITMYSDKSYLCTWTADWYSITLFFNDSNECVRIERLDSRAGIKNNNKH